MKQRDVVSSLERGLRVLTSFDQHSVRMTPAEVAKKTDLPRAATRRILLTLHKLGYAFSDGKYFRLTPKVLDLSHNYVRKDSVRQLIEPIMRDAVDAVKDSCTINIRDGDESLSVLTYNAPSFNAVNMSVGLRIPLFVSTPGRVMLADMTKQELDAYFARNQLVQATQHTIASITALRRELKHVRDNGFAVGREEWELGVYAISVPIRNSPVRLAGCITFVGNMARIATQLEIDRRISVLRQSAEQIAVLLPESVDVSEMLGFQTAA